MASTEPYVTSVAEETGAENYKVVFPQV
jgi:hypothetical protein